MMTRLRFDARGLLDTAITIKSEGFFGINDLPDTPMVMNALDEIEAILKDGDKREAIKCALRWAEEITEDEGDLLFD